MLIILSNDKQSLDETRHWFTDTNKIYSPENCLINPDYSRIHSLNTI